MSFYSSLILARAAPPPPVTGRALAEFVRLVAASGVVVDEDDLTSQLKYGPRVDQDDHSTDSALWEPSGMIGTVEDYGWDRTESFSSLTAMADALAGDGQSVYRADLNLGGHHPDIRSALTREPSPENEVGLYLRNLMCRVGPIVCGGLETDDEFFAGWIGLCFSGPGYFYPWEYREARARAEATGQVAPLAEACRTVWPVEPIAPSAETAAVRREIGALWLYDDFHLPQGWIWVVDETG